MRGIYRGYEIVSMPPPSSGGAHVIEILNILEGYPIGELGLGQRRDDAPDGGGDEARLCRPQRISGRPRFRHVPVAGLTSKAYADELRRRSTRSKATPSATIKPASPIRTRATRPRISRSSTRTATRSSNTYTLNFAFGSGLVGRGTGILLNNEMDDFSAKPGVPNAYGLIGGDANAVAPAKRPLSSMSPTIVLKDGKPFLVTGSPGGSRIITWCCRSS